MKRPKEIFGYPTDNVQRVARLARRNHTCPYMSSICTKQSRTIQYPMGVCSVQFGRDIVAICPNRFLENQVVFQDISNEVFGTCDNVLLFSEVRLRNVGSFDFVLAKHRPLSNIIENFCVVEFQTDSTTGTGKLVDALEDFMHNRTFGDQYNFGMNTYNTIKLAYIQMLVKGQVMESWKKNIIWVLQSYVFNNMKKRFLLKNLRYTAKNFNKYFIYNFKSVNDVLNLQLVSKKSSTVANLLTAFTGQPVPNMDDFVKDLEKRMNLRLGLNLTVQA